jgi:hypothetical protein
VPRLTAVLNRGDGSTVARDPRTLWRALCRWLRASTDEPALSGYYSTFRRSGADPAGFVLRHPLASVLALVATVRLPSRTLRLSAASDGAALHRALSRPTLFHAPLGATGVSVLPVPSNSADYVHGSGRQTLRRRLRSARRSGVTCRSIDAQEEREALLELANQAERLHPNPRYRIDRPANADLLQYDLWLGAFSAQGQPLLLSVTPIDGEWALLRYFRTLGRGPQQSDSRYMMCVEVVQALSNRGVRYLVDTWHPGEIPEGLRQFQRLVGYRIMRVLPRWSRLAASGSIQDAETLSSAGQRALSRLAQPVTRRFYRERAPDDPDAGLPPLGEVIRQPIREVGAPSCLDPSVLR